MGGSSGGMFMTDRVWINIKQYNISIIMKI
jgi:hypothetical protein